MKKLIILSINLVIICFGLQTRGAVHSVTVQDFQFIPSEMTVSVGDTVTWVWVNGSHTTTSTLVPDGANSWNADVNSTTSGFTYVVTVEGTYNYNCTIHPTQMTGSFMALNTTGISPITSNPFQEVSNSLLSDQLQVSYSLTSPASVNIALFDITGMRVKNFASAYHTRGEYSETFSVAKLPKGMYFLSLQSQDAVVTKKVVVE